MDFLFKKIALSMMSTGSGPNQLWNHFLRTKAGDSAICNVSKKYIKCSGGSISVLHNHLIRKHKINLLKRVQHDDAEDTCSNINITTSITNDTNSRSKISDYFNIIKTIDDSFPAVLARLTARDCLSF